METLDFNECSDEKWSCLCATSQYGMIVFGLVSNLFSRYYRLSCWRGWVDVHGEMKRLRTFEF